MKTAGCYIILWAGLLFSSCGHKDIVLETVKHTPGYIKSEGLYGEDIKSMEEKNAFIVETGKIDTTDEVPPTEFAWIVVEKKLIQLEQVKKIKDGNTVFESYAGNGYILTLAGDAPQKRRNNYYAKTKLTITQGRQKSRYTVFRKTGYF